MKQINTRHYSDFLFFLRKISVNPFNLCNLCAQTNIMEQINLIPSDDGFDVFLFLEGKQYKPKRIIGTIKDRTFYTYRNPDNMYFKKLNAIGINYRLLADGGTHFDYIKVRYGLTTLETTRKYFMCKGSFLHFKNNNLDKQIFLNVQDFGMGKAAAWELERKEKIEYEISYREKKTKLKCPHNGELFS